MPKSLKSRKRSKKSPKNTLSQKIFFIGIVIIVLALPIISIFLQKKQDTSINAHAAGSTWPATPPSQVCSNTALLSGPASAPAGAVVVPAGDNSSVTFSQPSTTYWFAPGTHTLGTGQYSQIVPGNNSTFIGAPGAILDGQKKNSYAFTQHATGVTIKYLTIQNFGAVGSNNNEGVVNHDAGQGWTIAYNTIQNNAGAGVFIGSNDTINYNCLTSNEQYGFSSYDPQGVSNITMDHNEITNNDTYDWESKISGCGCTGGGKFWDTHTATITNNYVHDNKSVGLWADTNDTDFLVDGNYIANNEGEGLMYEISYNMTVSNNNFVRNAITSGPTNPGFPTGAIYLSESGGDGRVPGRTGNIDIYNNNFADNWSGVILWENADRFCNSPANTSSGTCTLVNPAVTTKTCVSGTIANAPYYSDCRWKTQNVLVHNNVFSLNRATIPNCTVANGCGLQGVFSNWGTYPSWSPYQGDTVQQAITFHQNNVFSNNQYTGDWQFMAKDQGSIVDFATWQAAPYNQDAGSSFNGANFPTATQAPNNPTQSVPMPTPTAFISKPSPTLLPPNTPTPVHAAGNSIDSATSGLESGIGKWVNWYATSLSVSTLQAHTGTHSLQVKVTSPYGWGFQLNNWPGFITAPGTKTVSFWARAGVGKPQSVIMQVQWYNASRKMIQANQVTLSSVTSAWQQARTTVTAPMGVATVQVTFTGAANKNTTFYLDDIVVSP